MDTHTHTHTHTHDGHEKIILFFLFKRDIGNEKFQELFSYFK